MATMQQLQIGGAMVVAGLTYYVFSSTTQPQPRLVKAQSEMIPGEAKKTPVWNAKPRLAATPSGAADIHRSPFMNISATPFDR